MPAWLWALIVFLRRLWRRLFGGPVTIYYVRKGGNDANDGLSADLAHAWLTVDKAANMVAAGDTVHIGAGIYRETVTMDTSGAAGQQISFLGDFDGSQTGDAGLVIITAYDDEGYSGVIRADALAWGQKEFIVWKNTIFLGGTNGVAVNGTVGANLAWEGVEFHNCTMQPGTQGASRTAMYMPCGTGATPATAGLLLSACTLNGGIDLKLINNDVAHLNTKIVVQGCLAIGTCEGNDAMVMAARASTTKLYSAAGITIKNCIAIAFGLGLFYGSSNKNTANPDNLYNSVGHNCGYVTTGSSGGATNAYECVSSSCGYGWGWSALACTKYNCRDVPLLFAGLADHLYHKTYGRSPFRPWEIMHLVGGYQPMGVNQGHETYLPSVDLYGESFLDSCLGLLYTYFDGHDGASDPNSKWSSDANAYDESITTKAATATIGSAASNFLLVEGILTQGRANGVITQVRVRTYGYCTSAPETLIVEVYTDGLAETLGNTSQTNQTTLAWSAWVTLAAPAAGWTWATLAACEFKAWKTGAGVSGVNLAMVEVEVTCGAEGSLGAVAVRNRPRKETTTKYYGANSKRFDGAGWHDYFIPVRAQSTTITVFGRFDSNYGGASKPQMLIYNIPGVADQTATMTAVANTWEQLSKTFVPTSAGICRVRLKSRDTGVGKCFFDSLKRA